MHNLLKNYVRFLLTGKADSRRQYVLFSLLQLLEAYGWNIQTLPSEKAEETMEEWLRPIDTHFPYPVMTLAGLVAKLVRLELPQGALSPEAIEQIAYNMMNTLTVAYRDIE